MSKSAKGGQWERDICKYLSKWINGSEKPYVFWRGRGSGAMFTNSNEIGESFSGDVYCVRPEGKFLLDKFSIECKNGYSGASLDKHLKNNKNDTLKDFWTQAVDDAVKSDKLPMLIFKKKGSPSPWVGISQISFNNYDKYLNDLKFIHLRWGKELMDCYLFEMKEFFKVITPVIVEGKNEI